MIRRIIVYPAVLVIILVAYNFHAIRNSILFILHGGEWITYAKKDRETIYDIFNELKKNKPENLNQK